MLGGVLWAPESSPSIQTPQQAQDSAMQAHLPKERMGARREVRGRAGGKSDSGRKTMHGEKRKQFSLFLSAPNSTLALHRWMIQGKLGHVNLSLT